MAAGWSINRGSLHKDMWQWSAWGPRGSNRGEVFGEDEARKRAQRSYEDLLQPFGRTEA
jgi:hypothetical protein